MKRRQASATSSNIGCGLNLLSEDDLENIHNHTLDIMSGTGLTFGGKEALETFKEAGAQVDEDNFRVKIPPYMVEEAIRRAPSKVTLCGRIPENDLVLEGKRVYLTPFGCAVTVIDENGEFRESTKQDVDNSGTLTDALDNIDLAFEACTPRDKDQRMTFLEIYESNSSHTSKNVINTALGKREAQVLIEMAASISGGLQELQKRPIVTGCCCPISPLTYPDVITEALAEFAKLGLPYLVVSMALAGATSPVTLAGLLAMHNAEILAGIVLAQLINPGTPVLYGSASTNLDLRTGNTVVGCPEMAMVSAGVACLAQHYRLPSFVAGG